MVAAAEPRSTSETHPTDDHDISSGHPVSGHSVDTGRRILHCDMDCFFAAVHMRDDPSLAGKPVLIGGLPEGRGVVAAANYEARRFGVRSATPSVTALRRCPHAVFIRPDFSRYRTESEAIFAILREFSPTIQPLSIDEAFVDVSEIYREWGSATAVAESIRRRVLEERGLTVSVGVGPNKLVAKIASDFDKPDGLTVVSPARVGEFLAPMSVRALPGVGPATEKVLGRRGIQIIADLRSWDEPRLTEAFGRYGRRLYRYARGLDDRPVRTHRSRKSLGSERTFAEDLTELEEITAELRLLADRVADLELLQDVVEFKSRFYPRRWAGYDQAKPGSFKLIPQEHVLKVMRKDYDAMQDMIFGRCPEFDEIIKGLTELEAEINALCET